MTKKEHRGTKAALLVSVLSMVLCIAMLVGSTFAWFTDTATAGINSIQAGNLRVELQDESGASLEGQTLNFKRAEGAADTGDILWEPGCTYELPAFRIVNTGNLAFKYKVTVNGATGDTELLGVIEFTVKVGTADPKPLADWGGVLLPADATPIDSTEEEVKQTELITISGHMKEDASNDYQGKKLEGIGITVVATQYTYESDSTGNQYDKDVPTTVTSQAEFLNAINEGGKVVLAQNITLSGSTMAVNGDTEIDLNGFTITGAQGKSVLDIHGGTVTLKNGTIESSTRNPSTSESVLYAGGTSNVTVENCTIQSKNAMTMAVCTNGTYSKDAIVVIKNSTISTSTASGEKSFAAYIPAGNVSLLNCDVTGYLCISGGNVTIDGGTYTTVGFDGQLKIYNAADTAFYAKDYNSRDGAFGTGDAIFIADRRSGYSLTGLTIKNVTFHTEISGIGTAHAIKYVDMSPDGTGSRVSYVIENNTYNGAPTMFIDLSGTELG